MEPGSDCVVELLVSTVSQDNMVPFNYIVDDGFQKNDLPGSWWLIWIQDIYDDFKRVDLFMSWFGSF